MLKSVCVCAGVPCRRPCFNTKKSKDKTKPKDSILEKRTQPKQKEKKQVDSAQRNQKRLCTKKPKQKEKKQVIKKTKGWTPKVTKKPQDYTPILNSTTRGTSWACSIAGLNHRVTSRFVTHTLFLPRCALVWATF